jgi:hypothetical protein
MPYLPCTGVLLLLVVGPAAAAGAADANVSKGHRLLIEHGFQVQGMATRDDVFSPERYAKANYTAINWLWAADPSKHGPAPGFPWARWVGDEKQMPPVEGEAPYMPSLVALSLGDERHLNDPNVREPYIKWFNDAAARYPDTILYANNYGGQVNDAALADFIARGKPDMICFDTYPWRSHFATREPAPPAGGSPTAWYGELRRYREHARQSGVPLATYRQSFHAVQDYDQTVYRDPSASEFRLNTFGALAFNVKFLIDFTYNTGASSYFKTPGGDGNPTPLYGELQRVNREVRNLGKALVRLKPIDDAESADLHTTGVLFIRGRHRTGEDGGSTLNAVPVGFVPDAADGGYTDWESDRNDPHLRGWDVKNLGSRNGGLPGDVIISWFTVLDESFDGEPHRGEVYVMVTNGLSDVAGSSEQCRQEITLNFADHASTAAVERLGRESGQVEELRLPLHGKRRQLVLKLDGGTCELFKFKTGAPFVGVQR